MAIDFLKTISYHRFEAKSGKCFRGEGLKVEGGEGEGGKGLV